MKSDTFIVDKLGNKVRVPHGYKFQQGTNGKGIAVAPGSTSQEDMMGQIYEIRKGQKAHTNLDGTIAVTDFGEKPVVKSPPKKTKPPEFPEPGDYRI